MDMGWARGKSLWEGNIHTTDVAPPFDLGSAEFLISALTAAGVGMWQIDMISGDILWDAMTARVFGFESIASEAQTFNVHEDDMLLVKESMERCYRQGVPHDVEFRVVRPDGDIRWVHALAHMMPTADGASHRLAGIVTDISARKQAEFSMLESERQLRAIISNVPGIAYRCALEPPWHMTFISEAVERVTGYPPCDFISGAIDWESLVFPEDLERVTRTVQQSITARTRFVMEYRIVSRDGQIRWVHERGEAAYGEDGRPLFLEGFIGDIDAYREAGEKLRQAEERYRLISRAATDAIWDLDLETNELVSNGALHGLFGYQEDSLAFNGHWWKDRIHPDDYSRVVNEMTSLIFGSTSQYKSEHRLLRADGTYADIYATGYVVRDASGMATRMVGAMQDLTARKLADAALRESEALNRSIVEASTDCVTLLDLDGKLLFMNRTGSEASGIDDIASWYGRPWTDLWPEAVRNQVDEAIRVALAGGVGRFSESFVTRYGVMKWWESVVSPALSDTGEVTKLVAISRDVTDRREAEERLLWAATRDPLTNLANRTFFQQKLNDAAERAQKDGRPMGLMLLDLDDFKQVNDTLGHDAGDALLKTLSERLVHACGDAELIARLGGDEFALVIKNLDGKNELAKRAIAIQEVLREPIVHGGRLLDCHVTMGAAICPDHGTSPEELLKNADIALYVAKGSRRGGLITFEPAHRAEMQERVTMIHSARSALRDERILPHYQPKIVLEDGAIHGFEALLRWHHPDRGVQLPATISAAFEDLDVAAAISDRMIDRVIQDMRRWLDQGVEFGHVAVNAAAAEFRRDDFAEGVLERLQKAGLPPSRFHLEVTETVFLGRGAEYVERALKLLSESGVSIALDDFGTGYASLRHLKQFPVHVIKIDQSFVRDMGNDPDDAAIIEAVLNLGRSLKIQVVAEGIETAEQEMRLQEMGCGFGQGFLYAEAVRAEDVPALIGSWSALKLRDAGWSRDKVRRLTRKVRPAA